MNKTLKTKRMPSRKSLMLACDKLCKEIVFLRDKHCVTCGSLEYMTPGHLFSRVAHSTRWDLKNIYWSCRSCNLKHEYDPYPLTKYFINKYGIDAYDALHLKYGKTRPYKAWELVELKKSLQKELENV